jgi:hypothetical protein
MWEILELNGIPQLMFHTRRNPNIFETGNFKDKSK